MFIKPHLFFGLLFVLGLIATAIGDRSEFMKEFQRQVDGWQKHQQTISSMWVQPRNNQYGLHPDILEQLENERDAKGAKEIDYSKNISPNYVKSRGRREIKFYSRNEDRVDKHSDVLEVYIDYKTITSMTEDEMRTKVQEAVDGVWLDRLEWWMRGYFYSGVYIDQNPNYPKEIAINFNYVVLHWYYKVGLIKAQSDFEEIRDSLMRTYETFTHNDSLSDIQNSELYVKYWVYKNQLSDDPVVQTGQKRPPKRVRIEPSTTPAAKEDDDGGYEATTQSRSTTTRPVLNFHRGTENDDIKHENNMASRVEDLGNEHVLNILHNHIQVKPKTTPTPLILNAESPDDHKKHELKLREEQDHLGDEDSLNLLHSHFAPKSTTPTPDHLGDENSLSLLHSHFTSPTKSKSPEEDLNSKKENINIPLTNVEV